VQREYFRYPSTASNFSCFLFDKVINKSYLEKEPITSRSTVYIYQKSSYRAIQTRKSVSLSEFINLMV